MEAFDDKSPNVCSETLKSLENEIFLNLHILDDPEKLKKKLIDEILCDINENDEFSYTENKIMLSFEKKIDTIFQSVLDKIESSIIEYIKSMEKTKFAEKFCSHKIEMLSKKF